MQQTPLVAIECAELKMIEIHYTNKKSKLTRWRMYVRTFKHANLSLAVLACTSSMVRGGYEEWSVDTGNIEQCMPRHAPNRCLVDGSLCKASHRQHTDEGCAG